MVRLICWLLLGLSASAAWAQDAPEAPPGEHQNAERARISDEMRKLSKRGVWSGVERKYAQLKALGLKLSASDHLTAAYAARESGDLTLVHERLKAAAAIEGTKEIIDWLYDIDHNYGRVTLVVDSKRTAELVVKEMPLDPNQRRAVEAAVEACKKRGRFTGLLPSGHYEFATQPFRVVPGVGVRVEVPPKMRRKGLVEPVIICRDLPSATGN